MSKNDIYYKVLSKDNKAQNGGKFDYNDYLPKQNKDGTWKPGKWLPKREVTLCSSGWHITKHWNMWIKNDTDCIYEVEYKNKKSDSGGVELKIAAERIRLVKKVTFVFDRKLNTGDSNTGRWNTGDSNTGDSNTGDSNTGHSNTGRCNTGDSNTGRWNTGRCNTGCCNTGNSNTGDSNTGRWNTGDRNTGDSNTGHSNTGRCNTGCWNTGDSHSGYFNTAKHEAPIMMFGKLYDGDIPKFPIWLYVDIPTKECWLDSFKQANKDELQRTVELPNFDYDVFEEITGITKKMFDNRLKFKNKYKNTKR